MSKQQNGFGHWLLVLGLLVVVGVSAVGYRVYKHGHPSPTAAIAGVPTQIKSASDLQSASKALDSSSLPDPTSLNNDLKNLL